MSLRYKSTLIPNEFDEEPVDKDVYNDCSDECDEDHCIICGMLLPESRVCLQCGTDNKGKEECYI